MAPSARRPLIDPFKSSPGVFRGPALVRVVSTAFAHVKEDCRGRKSRVKRDSGRSGTPITIGRGDRAPPRGSPAAAESKEKSAHAHGKKTRRKTLDWEITRPPDEHRSPRAGDRASRNKRAFASAGNGAPHRRAHTAKYGVTLKNGPVPRFMYRVRRNLDDGSALHFKKSPFLLNLARKLR